MTAFAINVIKIAIVVSPIVGALYAVVGFSHL